MMLPCEGYYYIQTICGCCGDEWVNLFMPMAPKNTTLFGYILSARVFLRKDLKEMLL